MKNLKPIVSVIMPVKDAGLLSVIQVVHVTAAMPINVTTMFGSVAVVRHLFIAAMF